MLLFLNYILDKIDKMNLEFQSIYFRLDTLYSTIAGEYRSILAMFIDDEVIASEKLASINPLDVSIYNTLENLNVGVRCAALLLKELLHEDVKKRFLLDCRKILVELCQQMKKRFTFQEDSALALLC